MSKAEEFAIKKYPVSIEDIHGHKVDVNLWQRKACVEGYHQAEKDLEPTLEAVEIIINAFLDLCIENKEQENTKRYTDKEWCQEVLKRFKAQKV